jgi:hypothetical protein
MANTTNFGWETPDDTDLVKDGAAAMRTLGNSIDASFVDLKGGTTGQVLAKNSNTDLDFVWSADASGISATIFDAKGDLIAASAADTAARLASSGVNGDVLTVDTSTSTGLKWSAPASGGLTLLSTVTLSGASTTLSNISQSYTSLLLVGSGIYGSSSGEFVININNGTDVWQTAGYSSTIAGFAQTAWKISADRSVNTSNSLPLAFAGFIYNYTSTSTYKPVQSFGYNYTGSTQESCWTMGGYRNTSAVTSLVFDTSGDGSGTILVYGVK